MATQNNLHVPDDLLAELSAMAKHEGRTVDEVAEQVIRTSLEDSAWRELLAYGRQQARLSGHTELDVPRIVRESRARHRQ